MIKQSDCSSVVCCEGCGRDTTNDCGFCWDCMPAEDRFTLPPLKETERQTSRPRVYISGPISKGDQQKNFDQAAFIQRELIEAGMAPLNPMLTMALPGHQLISHPEWVAVDLPWVEVSDAVLRLPGESIGADQETEHAENCGVPVFHSFGEIKAYFS